MSDAKFRGIFPYLVSPVDADGNVMGGVLSRLVDRLVCSGVHGLTPLGSTGEFAYLSTAQRRRVVEVVLEASAGRVPVVAGIAGRATAHTVQEARDFEMMGVDGILAILDAYFPLPHESVIDYFAEVAGAVSCPVVLYTNPSFQKVDLTLEVIERLVTRAPNIRYLKDASNNTGHLLSVIDRLGDYIDVFSASSHIPLCVMLIGGVGWMSGPACLVPSESVRLYNLALSRKWDEAMGLQRRMWSINEVFAKYSLAPCIKAGLDLQGFPVGDPLPPLRPLALEAREEVRQALEAIGAL